MPLKKKEKNVFSIYSVRGTDLLLVKAQKRKRNVFFTKTHICFHEPFRNGKETCSLFSFYRPIFFVKKSSLKSINIGSSSENLDARNPTVKIVRDLDARLKYKMF